METRVPGKMIFMFLFFSNNYELNIEHKHSSENTLKGIFEELLDLVIFPFKE